MSGNDAKEVEAEFDAAATVRVALRTIWDASLTFDLLDDPHDNVENGHGPIFVGREELLGALVNAVGQPDRRGTYLVSGYRGVGKTSLIIQATRLARSGLQENGWQLLPVILNVSEISASLEPLSSVKSDPLKIDARRLLTALLRALRNRVPVDMTHKGPNSNQLAKKIQWAYQKAGATRYIETEQQRAESVDTTVRESRQIFHMPDVFKLVAAVALLAGVALEGIALVGSTINQLHVLAISLAGVAAFSIQRSVVLTRNSTQEASASSELVRDNSVHQLESELKDILEDLYKEKRRTVIILEELDKIDDKQGGHQLDLVIRYFKNLFTQAPALFFFVTDKSYYDLISKKIGLARQQRSYAVEHTFFTHRLFISRPRIEECLQYLIAAFLDPNDSMQVEIILKSQGNRVRGLDEMPPLEHVVRTLLFRSQDHFFDLKNEMRQFVSVDSTGSWLESNDDLMSKSDRALAAFQFLVEQKMRSYRFGGRNDYANEELRNYLFAVFTGLGSSEQQQIGSFYPGLGPEGDPLSLGERLRIIEAVNSLVEDLQRGGAINWVSSDAGTAMNEPRGDLFLWKDQAAVSFEPVAHLEPHEQALFDDLSRMALWAKSFGQSGLRRQRTGIAARAKGFADDTLQQVQVMRRSPVAIPIEDALRRRREAEKQIGSLHDAAISAHQRRLADVYGFNLHSPLKTPRPTVFTLPPSASLRRVVLLVYESFSQFSGEALREMEGLERLAVVNVVLGDPPMRTHQSPIDGYPLGWPVDLIPVAPDEGYLVSVPFFEDLETGAFDDEWGKRTADELRLAQIWCESEVQPTASGRVSSDAVGPYLLHSTGRMPKEIPSLRDVYSEWLKTDDRVLAWTSAVGPPSDAIEEQFTSISGDRPRVIVPYGWFVGSERSDQESASLDRLIATNRIVLRADDSMLSDSGLPPLYPRVVLELVSAPWQRELTLREIGVSIVHREPSEADFMTVFQLVAGRYPDDATSVLRGPAETGNTEALATLTIELADRNPSEAREWRTRLAQSGDTATILEAARSLEPRRLDDALELYRPVAETGNPDAMTRLTVLLADRNPEEASRWQALLDKG
jgi:hypothetical protein